MSPKPPVEETPPNPLPWRYPRWWAHRGAGRMAPENTLAAFRLGAQHGFRAFECDVKISADGVAFLLHDTELERTTGEPGVAEERNWAALSQLDAGRWHSPEYAGEPIPSLSDTARFCLETGSDLNIEIKPTPGNEARTGALVASEAARLWHGQARAPLLSSFSIAALEAARAAAPHLPRALLLDELGAGWFEQAQTLGCCAVVMDHPLLDATLVDQLHSAGLFVMSYTVNDATVAERLLRWGVDGLITDVMDRAAWPAGFQLR
jgi:glycerophosphoryl diester phosphodiesterase